MRDREKALLKAGLIYVEDDGRLAWNPKLGEKGFVGYYDERDAKKLMDRLTNKGRTK